ncbi:MAG TPA: DivIVA domain-containing protein [Solirubrobacteraceae bacterium]|nr:DivIVA domain-containing protein [Solirubrobacteraceae bacterium]
MDLDRQAIERKDFPIGRRGYDPDAVDNHLRALAGEFEEMQRAAAHGSPDLSLASSAATQVQSILEAAEATAADIEHNALEEARSVREEADRDADRNREESLERARAHVSAVEQAAAGLLERVGSMESEVGALVESLRAGARRLATDLAAVETGMHELYDAASGRGLEGVAPASAPAPAPAKESKPAAVAADEPVAAADETAPAPAPEPPAPEPATEPAGAAPEPSAAPEPAHESQEAVPGDIDGARLVALNMALNGESRADTERYLAENFELPDRLKLIDEVYAAVEG